MGKKINPGWGAAQVVGGKPDEPIKIGPLYHGLESLKYLKSVELEVEDKSQLEQLAEEQGLRIIPDGYYDLDGPREYHYKFIELN